MRRLDLGLAAVLLWAARPAAAAPLTREEVPAALQPWVSWALKGHEQALCPFLHASDRRDCAWPGLLNLSLDEGSGRFEQRWRVYSEAWVPLPGSPERWPQEVRVDGAVVPVVARGAAPALRLKAGTHVVTGAFRWTGLPEQLQVPAETGLLSLRLRGQAVPFPTRDEAGRLWVQARPRPAPAREESQLEVSVHRRLVDEIPLQLVTRVQLKVSGDNRETLLARALPEGFTPMSLTSPLPARLEPDGRLRVQARAGTWDLALVARREGRDDDIRLLPSAVGPIGPVTTVGPWDQDEAWVFEARPDLRQAELEGVPSLDPQQTELPGDWRSLPAFLVRPGDALRLVQRRRGDDPPAPDRLALAREIWLDFDGRGFSVRDAVSGTLARSWRLEAEPQTRLGRVAADGLDQFLTALSSGGPAGLELRSRQISVEADSRVDGRRLAAAGWRHDFESVSARLHLPPGWRLLHAGGVDQAAPTWVSTWTLLDFFLVLVAAAACGRLWSAAWGLAALAGLALSWHEPGAPRWLWLLVLLGAALERALAGREGAARWAQVGRRLAWLVLALNCVPFLVTQLRHGLYPSLERPYQAVHPQPGGGGAGGGEGFAAPTPASPRPRRESKMMAVRGLLKSAAFSAVEELESAASEEPMSLPERADKSSYYSDVLNQMRLDPKSSVNTGPGLPYWTWTEVNLTWKGPVPQGHRVRLWLIPPGAHLALTLLRAALVVLLAALLAGLPVGDWLRRLRRPGGGSAAALGGLLLALGATRAETQTFPPRELLDELRGRLLERPDCAPLCAESPSLRLQASGQWLSLRQQLHAATDTAVPVPSGGREWSPARALLDGAPAAVRRGEDGTLWLAVPAGSHELTLEGPLPDRDSVQLALPLKPRRVDSSVAGWTLHGLRNDGQAEDALQLSRARGSEPAAAEAARAQGIFPPFLHVQRILRLGLSWSMETRVTRLTPPGSPITAQIPLLPGESVTSPDLRVVQGKAQLSLPPQAHAASWSSVLKETGSLALVAPKTTLWSEAWRVEPGPLWHVEAAGLSPVHEPAQTGPRARSYRPWPGESVTLLITRPAAVAGQTLTIDESRLELRPGLRATDAALALSLRSSRGGRHTLTLPEGSELLDVRIDGAARSLRAEGRALTLPVQPGAHSVEVDWRQPGGARLLYRTPQLSLGSRSVNAHISIAMPDGRWTLLLGGPGLGPAVLFWSLLAVFALASLGLSKTGLAPLSWRHWLLLSLGLTQIPVTSAAIVAGWFLAIGLRGAHPPQGNREFKLAQLFLGFFTVVAAICLFRSIMRGLLGAPDMQIAGNGSSAQLLRWYLDRAGEELPRPWVFSAPLWVYRAAMLAWALWLADSLLRWTRWAWGCFTTEGLWR